MRGRTALAFGMLGLLAGCGHDAPPPASVSVRCDGSLMLAGASSVSATATAGGTTLSFPDPVNVGQTGSLPVQPGHACTITPDTAKADSGDGHPGRRPAS